MITKTGFKRFIKNFILLIVVLLICFFIVEFSLRYMEKIAPGTVIKFPEVIRPLNNHELYYELIPNVEDYRFKNTTISINSQGLRDYEYPLEKPDDVYRIASLGDSIAFGWGVNIEDSYAKKLEEKLKVRSDYKFEVLDFGVPGYYSDQELNQLKQKVLAYDPDMVILMYVFNDAEVAPRYSLDKKVFFYRKTVQYLKYKSYTFSFLFYNYAKIRQLFQEKETTEGDYAEYLEKLFSDDNPGWNISKNSLLEIKKITDENDIDFVMFIYPSIESDHLQNYESRNIHEIIKKFAEDNDIRVVDLLPYFLYNKDKKLELEIDAHPNEFAHNLMSEVIFSAINPQ